MNRFLLPLSFALLASLLGAAAGLSAQPKSQRVESGQCLFTALDVGQGDAILMQTPDQQDVLIDAGASDRVVEALDRNLPLGNNDLELVVATHPDSDHIGGLPSVPEQYQVTSVMTTGVLSGTATDKRWQAAKEMEEVKELRVRAGERYDLGMAMTLEVLWPDDAWLRSNPKAATNDTSIVLRVTCAGSTVLLTGDLPSTLEEKIMDSGQNVVANLLKVGHHGSRYSTSSRFLRAVQPSLAVISVGANNRYGHPHVTVVERLTANNIQIRRTDLEGDIRLRSDGQGGWE